MIQVYKTVLWLLEPAERRRLFVLMGLVTIGSLIEATSIASILPLLSVLADPGIIERRAVLSTAYELSGAASIRQFQIYLAMAVFAFVLLGIAVKMLNLYAIARFSKMRGFTLSSRLLQGYLHQPYHWFLNRHSSDLGKSLLSEVNILVGSIIMPSINLIASLALVVFLVGLLLMAEPVVALVAALVLAVSYGAIYLGVRTALHALGQKRMMANRERFFITQEATGGIKDVKLLGLEDTYVRRFNDPARKMASYQATTTILKTAPRHLLEVVSFGGILTIILVMLFTSAGSLEAVIPTLGTIAFASLRLLPALQRTFSAFASMQSGKAALDELVADFKEIEKNRENRFTGPPPPRLPLRESLVLDDIHYAYPEAEGAALRGISLEIDALTTVGLVGGTGAGKTTTVDLLLGLLRPERGTILVDGVPVTRERQRAWQRSVGYVPQHIFLTADTIAANIAFGVPKDKIDMAAVEKAARQAALHDFVMEELPEGYETEVGERGVRLSGGQRQRVGIARALYTNPDVLVMDEATSALDNVTEHAIMEAVYNVGGQKTVILIAHRLSTVKKCDKIFMLEQGRVTASGTFGELVERNRSFAEMAQYA